MELEHLFNGSALSAVDAKGRLSVPSFIRGVIERRSDAKAVVIGMHEASPCLNAYDRGYAKILYAENERRRLAEEAAGGDLAAHHARVRRTFGLTEDVPYDTSGRIILPPMMRRKGELMELALFLGTGETFQIWNPKLLLKDPRIPADLKDITRFRLEEKGLRA